jgi:hypothetical protein
MLCSNCPNFAKLKIVPERKQCVSCYNFQQWQTGEPYICNYCCMTCLRVIDRIACESCDRILTNKYIPKVDLVNQSNYAHCVNQFGAMVFRHNLNLLKKIHEKKTGKPAEDTLYMSSIPKSVVKAMSCGFCDEKHLSDIYVPAPDLLEEIKC